MLDDEPHLARLHVFLLQLSPLFQEVLAVFPRLEVNERGEDDLRLL